METTFLKVVIGIDIDDIGNLENLLKLVFINKKCGDLKVVIDGGELTRNINQKKTSNVLQAYIDLHSLTNAQGVQPAGKTGKTEKKRLF